MKPNVLDINCETQEQTIREMTDAEYEQYLIDQTEYETRENNQK